MSNSDNNHIVYDEFNPLCQLINKYPAEEWNHDYLSQNCNITPEIVNNNPHFDWNVEFLFLTLILNGIGSKIIHKRKTIWI